MQADCVPWQYPRPEGNRLALCARDKVSNFTSALQAVDPGRECGHCTEDCNRLEFVTETDTRTLDAQKECRSGEIQVRFNFQVISKRDRKLLLGSSRSAKLIQGA